VYQLCTIDGDVDGVGDGAFLNSNYFFLKRKKMSKRVNSDTEAQLATEVDGFLRKR
jgi:hypothetical protein